MPHRAQRRMGERNEPYGGTMKTGEGLLATPPAEDDPGRRRFNSHSAAGAGRRGIAQAVRSGIRAGAALATALLVIGSMAWVASGRLDATWPARNVLEARLRAGAPVLVGDKVVEPASLGAGRKVASGLGDLPAPLLIALALVAAGALAALAIAIPTGRRDGDDPER